MNVIFSAGAGQDLREIFEYIAEDNLDAAISFVQRLRLRCLDVAPMPNIGRKRDDIRPGYRSVTEGEYVIIYRVRDESVDILHVVHGKRDISKIVFPQE